MEVGKREPKVVAGSTAWTLPRESSWLSRLDLPLSPQDFSSQLRDDNWRRVRDMHQ